MTFRAKPVVKRSAKSWESRDRRNFFTNLAFGLVVVAAILILVAAIGVSYYQENLASVASVNGQPVTRAELRERTEIEAWRLDEAGRRVRTQTVAGRLTPAQAELQTQIITQQRQQIVGIALERLIDNRIQAQLAAQEGVEVTDADIDARLLEEATTPESRHAWLIEVKPTVEPGALDPTPAAITAARAKADAALRDLQSGTSWDDVAKTVSTDASTAPQNGDLGWLSREDSQADDVFLTAIYEAEVGSPTSVLEGQDGIFRIGRVTEIAPISVDGAYRDKIVNDGVDLENYLAVVRGDAIRKALEDKIVADAVQPGPQRQAAEFYLSAATAALPPEAVRVRHILYSPKDDPGAASSGEIPEDDPSWAAAKEDADAAHAKLVEDPEQFDAIARAESDEASARGDTGTGGKLNAWVSEDSNYVESFSAPILAADAQDGDILAPIKSEFGWHVVQILAHVPELADIKRRVDAGTADFAQLARDLSEGAEAARGGDLGWVARGQYDERLTDAIFAADVGKTSEIVVVEDDGEYLYRVVAEEVRTPEGRQLAQIRATAFGDWYQEKKATFDIQRESATSDPLG